MESPSIRQLNHVDDAAIFIDDTFDADTVRCIAGTSPSAVVMLSPQRMPFDADGNSPAAKLANMRSSSQSPSAMRGQAASAPALHSEEYTQNRPQSRQQSLPLEYTVGASSSTQKGRRGSAARQFGVDVTNQQSQPQQSPSVGQRLCFSNCSTPVVSRTAQQQEQQELRLSQQRQDSTPTTTRRQTQATPAKALANGNVRRAVVVTITPTQQRRKSESGAPSTPNTRNPHPLLVNDDDDDDDTLPVDIATRDSEGLLAPQEEPEPEPEAEPMVPLSEYEKLEKDRNRYREMYRYQAQLCDDLYKKERSAQEALQEKIIEIVALSSRNEESKRFIRQMKKEMLQCRERALPFLNRKLDEIKVEKEVKDKYDSMLNIQREHFARMEQELREELAAQQALLNDYKVASSLGKSSESLLRASYHKNTQMYGELCRARREWNNELDNRMDLERQVENLRKEKRDAELALAKERRRNYSREDSLQQDVHMLQEEIIQLTSDLLELKLSGVEEEQQEPSVHRRSSTSSHSHSRAEHMDTDELPMEEETECAVEVEDDEPSLQGGGVNGEELSHEKENTREEAPRRAQRQHTDPIVGRVYEVGAGRAEPPNAPPPRRPSRHNLSQERDEERDPLSRTQRPPPPPIPLRPGSRPLAVAQDPQ